MCRSCPAFDLIGLELGERDLAHARDADRLCGCLREVYDATMGVRAPVVDAHHRRLACALVGDPQLGAKRQGLVGRGQSVGIERLAIGGALAVKAGAVPGGRTSLDRLGLLGSSRDGSQRASKNNRSDAQGVRSFGHALWAPFDAMHNTTYCAATKALSHDQE